MKGKRYESQLPEGYRLVRAVNLKARRTATALSLISILILVLTMLTASLFLIGRPMREFLHLTAPQFYIGYGVFFVSMLLYFLLHELTHGLCYKIFTGRKLTYAISLRSVYSGVPDVYLYRPYALITALAPLALFSCVFIPLLIYVYYQHALAYLAVAFMLGMHLGACAADVYVCILALGTREARLLIRDTGTEQFFYLPHSKN